MEGSINKRKRKSFTLKDKVDIIRKIEAGEKQEALARAQGVAGSKILQSLNL